LLPLKLAFIRSRAVQKYVEKFTVVCNIQHYENISLIIVMYTSFLQGKFVLIPFTTIFCVYWLLFAVEFMLPYAIFTIIGLCEFIINK